MCVPVPEISRDSFRVPVSAGQLLLLPATIRLEAIAKMLGMGTRADDRLDDELLPTVGLAVIAEDHSAGFIGGLLFALDNHLRGH